MVLCSAFGCKNVGTHLFPRETKLKKQWEAALKRKSFQASEHSRLCSSHFQPEDFLKEGFDSGVQSKRKIIKKGTVPSVFLWKKSVLGESTTERGKRAKARDIRRQLLPQEISEEQPEDYIHEVSHVVEVSSQDVSAEEDVEVEVPQFKHIGTQKNYVLYTIESFRGDDKGVHFYTGLESYEKFMFVLSTSTPEVYSLQYRWKQVLNISVEDQFLLTLMKLRRNKQDYELARFFDLHPSSVSNIFVTWINFMHQMWEMLDIWPSRELVNFYMPEGFAKSYPSTRVIVDCTEIPVQKPSNPAAQQVLWSSYKNRSTVKLEVGATPSGLLSHCSEAYGGSTSDRQMNFFKNVRKEIVLWQIEASMCKICLQPKVYL